MKHSFLWFALAFSSLSVTGYACPGGQHQECAIPRPWGGCAQNVCVPDLSLPAVVPGDFAYNMICAKSVQVFVEAGLTCVGCIGAATGTAYVVAGACAGPCGLTTGAFVAALKTCRI